jgi:hypothetical protein
MHTERRKANLIRPGTLVQVLQLVHEGEKLRFCMAGFLDGFYGDTNLESRARRIADDPGRTDDPKMNALFGAIGEHLTMRWNLGAPPAWTCQPERFLDRPWFMGHERMKGFLLAESPLAFRRRFIFTEAEPLRRASMQRDGRWWAYETIRSGLAPTAEEQRELDHAGTPAFG